MKIRRFVKRAVAYVLAAIMTLSIAPIQTVLAAVGDVGSDRKSTRLNSSHQI